MMKFFLFDNRGWFDFLKIIIFLVIEFGFSFDEGEKVSKNSIKGTIYLFGKISV